MTECRKYENKVQDFLEDSMSDKDTQEFIEHVKTCARCFEELEIYYTIYRGLDLIKTKQIERAQITSRDELKELLDERDARISSARTRKLIKRVLIALGIGMSLLVVGLIGLMVFVDLSM